MSIFNLTNGAVFDMWAIIIIVTLFELYNAIKK